MRKPELSHDERQLINWVVEMLSATNSALSSLNPAFSLTAKLILEICFSDVDPNKNLAKDIRQLKETHLESAYDYLAAAMRVENTTRRDELIDDARKEFTQASHLQDTNFNIAKTQYQVGLCFSLLNDQENAMDWYKKSYRNLQKSIANPHKPSAIFRFVHLEAKLAKDRQRKLTPNDRMKAFYYVEGAIFCAFTIIGLPIAWQLVAKYTDLLIKAGYEFEDPSVSHEQIEFGRLLRSVLTNEATDDLVATEPVA